VDSRFRGNDVTFAVGVFSSMSAVNQRRGAEGELWQPRFFDRALRTVKEYNESSNTFT
jgi:hypothetical protein